MNRDQEYAVQHFNAPRMKAIILRLKVYHNLLTKKYNNEKLHVKNKENYSNYKQWNRLMAN